MSSRREFMKMSAAVASVCVLPITTEGCDTSALTGLVSVLGSSVASIVTLLGMSTLASTITQVTSDLKNAISNWKRGSPAQDIVQIINTLIQDIDQVPVGGVYAALITLALNTLAAIINIVDPTAAAASAALTPNHRRLDAGQGAKTASEYKAKWNGLRKSDARLAGVEKL